LAEAVCFGTASALAMHPADASSSGIAVTIATPRRVLLTGSA
jgi:hypothetical protein